MKALNLLTKGILQIIYENTFFKKKVLNNKFNKRFIYRTGYNFLPVTPIIILTFFYFLSVLLIYNNK